jgi:hypothetical protein
MSLRASSVGIFSAVVTFSLGVGLTGFYITKQINESAVQVDQQELVPFHNSACYPEINESDLATIRRYAERYEPRSGREVIPSPPVLDDDVSAAVTRLAQSGKREHEKYIILIFLRLSRFHIEHFKYGYEIGRENPLTREFNRLVGVEDYLRPELLTADLAEEYVEAHAELLEYPPIAVEMKRIDKARKKN